MMNYYKSIIIQIMLFALVFAKDDPFYISPGLRFGYQWGSGFTIGAKLSFGHAYENNMNYPLTSGPNSEFEYITPEGYRFYNVTIGVNALAVPQNNDGKRNYWYIEGQYGAFGKIHTGFPCTGLTAGLWRYKGKANHPKFGIFTGFGGCIELDVRIDQLKLDTGVSGSFPLVYDMIKN
ncbi:MAG: hypothetical protein ACE5D0_01440 [Fidelibacterota bacterium]